MNTSTNQSLVSGIWLASPFMPMVGCAIMVDTEAIQSAIPMFRFATVTACKFWLRHAVQS